jgi:hypothetical protein
MESENELKRKERVSTPYLLFNLIGMNAEIRNKKNKVEGVFITKN